MSDNKVRIRKDKNGQLVAYETLTFYALYELNGKSHEIIKKLKDDINYYKKQGFNEIIYEQTCHPYADDGEVIGIFGIRKPTDKELESHLLTQHKDDDIKKQYRREQYEQLKKEFG